MVETARTQYVFLDVVGFTKNRSVEAQSDVVGALNVIVNASLELLKIPSDKTILLPTGDGMAIAILEWSSVDIHLLLARSILAGVAEHNSRTNDPTRCFQLRLGINENIDNVIEDINGRRNMAGSGISMAQRIMDKGDGGHILVGATVYEILRERELYMSTWRAFTARGKHGVTFPVYQFVSKDAPGLNVEIPSVFIAGRREPEKLTRFIAYYLGHALANREFLVSRNSDPTRDYSATILLSFLAEDSVSAAETPIHEGPIIVTWHAGQATFEDQYKHYKELEFWVMARLASALQRELAPYVNLFEVGAWTTSYWLVAPAGIQALVEQWPQVAGEFGIHKPSAP